MINMQDKEKVYILLSTTIHPAVPTIIMKSIATQCPIFDASNDREVGAVTESRLRRRVRIVILMKKHTWDFTYGMKLNEWHQMPWKGIVVE